MGESKSISPAVVGIIVAVAVVLVVVAGLAFMNRPRHDPIADAMAKERARAGITAPVKGPLNGSPPKAGATDYARPADSPLAKH